MVKKMLNNRISDFIAWLLVCCAVFGCSPEFHVNKVNKHTQKALKKGIVIPKDTVTVNTTDTLTTILTRNDTTFITKTVTNTVTLEPTVEIKTKWQTRYETKYKYKTVKVENKAMVDSLNQVLKQERQKTKQVKHENKKSNWWIWLITGAVLGLAGPFIIKRFI